MLELNKQTKQNSHKQTNTSNRLIHPTILKLYDEIMIQQTRMLVFEPCEMFLSDLLVSQKLHYETLERKLQMCLDILTSIEFLHANNVILNNISPAGFVVKTNSPQTSQTQIFLSLRFKIQIQSNY